MYDSLPSNTKRLESLYLRQGLSNDFHVVLVTLTISFYMTEWSGEPSESFLQYKAFSLPIRAHCLRPHKDQYCVSPTETQCVSYQLFCVVFVNV